MVSSISDRKNPMGKMLAKMPSDDLINDLERGFKLMLPIIS